MTTYEDIIYEERPKGVARITINRPEATMRSAARRLKS